MKKSLYCLRSLWIFYVLIFSICALIYFGQAEVRSYQQIMGDNNEIIIRLSTMRDICHVNVENPYLSKDIEQITYQIHQIQIALDSKGFYEINSPSSFKTWFAFLNQVKADQLAYLSERKCPTLTDAEMDEVFHAVWRITPMNLWELFQFWWQGGEVQFDRKESISFFWWKN